jgi:hypothetical protein
MAIPSQAGAAMIVTAPPTFTNYIIQEGSWKLKEATQVSRFKNESSKTVNVTFTDEGQIYTCVLGQKTGASDVKIGDILTDSASKKWVVTDADVAPDDAARRIQNVTLEYYVGDGTAVPVQT